MVADRNRDSERTDQSRGSSNQSGTGGAESSTCRGRSTVDDTTTIVATTITPSIARTIPTIVIVSSTPPTSFTTTTNPDCSSHISLRRKPNTENQAEHVHAIHFRTPMGTNHKA